MQTADDLLAGRVLAFTRAEALYADLTAAADTLATSMKTHLTDQDETLVNMLDVMRTRARSQWLGASGMPLAEYQGARAAVVNRARTLARRATAAAEAATALAELFELAEHYDTESDLTWLIDGLANRTRAGAPWESVDGMENAYADVWARLRSKLVGYEQAQRLRRYYDVQLQDGLAQLPAMHAAVTEWRNVHLGKAIFDADTYAYAITTARDWEETADLWRMLGDDQRERPDGPDVVRLRTLIADKVAEVGDTNVTVPESLLAEVRKFNTETTMLSMRLHMAEQVGDLHPIATQIMGRTSEDPRTINLMRSLCRRFDHIATEADTEPDYRNDSMANMVYNWRRGLHDEANRALRPAGVGYSEEYRYTLAYNALADAVDSGDDDQRRRLCEGVERIATAEAHHLLTAEHIENLRAVAAPKGERIAVNGADL